MLEHKELLQLHDKAFLGNQDTRERAADDLAFYWISQWSDDWLSGSSLKFRGEFNILRKAGRQINTDLSANEIQIDFEPKDDTRDDAADIADGIYRTADRKNTSQEAYKNARGEAVVCGYGAWELYHEYRSNRAGDEEQVICRRPLYEANNNVFWDPNARLADKSDARYVSILEPYTAEGYRDLVEELTGDDPGEVTPQNFATPEQTSFGWCDAGNNVFYVASFYHREKVKDKILTLADPLGVEVRYRESQLDEHMDALLEGGYSIVDEKEITRWECTKYIATGEETLKHYTIAGGEIPVVPMYGERAFVEGREHYEGITRLAKDPQRLRNFQLSYLADIVSKSPREKDVYHPEQIQGFEFMYEEAGADNDHPYLLANRTDANGEPLPIGPVNRVQAPQIPQALAASIDLSRQAVEDVANPGTPQDIADTDLSGKAVAALQRRIDDQSMVYQEGLKHAKRRDAEIFAAMASEVIDTPRTVTVTRPDGTTEKKQVMSVVIDQETGEPKVLNDLTNIEWEVYADIGPSYTSKKDETKESLDRVLDRLLPDDPLRELVMLQRLTLEDGVSMQAIRDYSRKQMVLKGYVEPESEEELAMLQQAAQQQGQPDANTILAMAEDKKAQADLMREQREAVKDQADIENAQAKTQIDLYKATTDRGKLEVEAQKAGAEIGYKGAQAMGQKLDNIAKREMFRGRISPAPRSIQ